VTDSFLAGGTSADFGPLAQPDCCGNNIEEPKAIVRKNLRMKPSMHLDP